MNQYFYNSIQACYVEGQKMYMVNSFFPMILSYDLQTNCNEVVSYEAYPHEYVRYGVSDIYKQADELFIFFRHDVRAVVIYDLGLGSSYTIIDDYEMANNSQMYKTERYESIIYIIPYDLTKGISRFDLDKKIFLKPLYPLEGIGKEYNYIGLAHTFITQNGISVFPYKRNMAIQIETDGQSFEKKIEDNVSIENVVMDGDRFYITSFTDKMLRIWSLDNGVTGKSKLDGLLRNSEIGINICSIIPYKNTVLCTSFTDEKVSLINLGLDHEKVIDAGNYCKRVNDCNSLFGGGIVYGNSVLLFPGASDNYLWFNMINGNVSPVSARLSKEDVELANAYRIQSAIRNDVLYESEEQTLQHYIKAV